MDIVDFAFAVSIDYVIMYQNSMEQRLEFREKRVRIFQNSFVFHIERPLK